MLNVKKLLTKIMNQQDDMLKVVHNVPLESSGSVPSGQTSDMIRTDISSYIPTGYELLYATLRGTSNYNIFVWYFDWVGEDSRIDYRATNTASTARTTSPTANLICVKIGGVLRSIRNAFRTPERGWAVC